MTDGLKKFDSYIIVKTLNNNITIIIINYFICRLLLLLL